MKALGLSAVALSAAMTAGCATTGDVDRVATAHNVLAKSHNDLQARYSELQVQYGGLQAAVSRQQRAAEVSSVQVTELRETTVQLKAHLNKLIDAHNAVVRGLADQQSTLNRIKLVEVDGVPVLVYDPRTN
jgi:microcompartment protein CcmL/EutN